LVGDNTNQRAIHIIGGKWEVEDIVKHNLAGIYSKGKLGGDS
jgi:hypothetical protein